MKHTNVILLTFCLSAVLVEVNTSTMYRYSTREYYTSVEPWPYPITVQLQYGLEGAIGFFSNSRVIFSCGVTETDGRVICRILGMPHGPAYPRLYSSSYRYGDSFRTPLNCRGDETDIHYCSPPYPTYGSCYETSLDCHTHVRLVGVGGNPVRSGILEVLVNGTWGTICDDNFDSQDADVFCRMLGFRRNFTSGYSNGATVATRNLSSYPIWMDDLACMGSEADIAECNFNGWGQHNCGHNEDVMLVCTDDSTTASYEWWTETSSLTSTESTWGWYNAASTTIYNWWHHTTTTERPTTAWWHDTTANPITVHLQSGLNGTIRFYFNYREIYSCSVTEADSRVICRMLGMSHGPASPLIYSTNTYRYGESFRNSFNCRGDETDIRYCSPPYPVYGSCYEAGLDCRTSARLVEVYGNPVGSGIVEVYVNGQWGTVCDDAFDYRDADVFCRMLGFNKSSQFTSRNSYNPIASDPSSHPIWMDDLACMGNESDIAECNFSGWGRHDCRHEEDVMLFCVNDSSTTTESYWRQTSPEISTPITIPYNYWWYTTYWWYYTSTVFTSTTTPWYYPTSGYSLDNAITASCTSSGWYIQVDMYRLRQMYPNARESDIYLGENSCTGYSNGYTLVFQHGIRDCLTSETITQNAIVYRNRLFYAMRDPQYQFIIRAYNWTLEVECDVFRNETASSHISHNTIGSLDSGHVVGTSHYNITMRFYSDPNFQYEIPGNPLHVTVGSDVYVKAYTDASDWGIKMIVHTCYTKPDLYASDSLKYYIIRDGCEADVNTHYISQSTHETKFMFRDFEYTSNHEGLYLYCDATFCETSSYSNQCQQSCNPRGKREADSRPRLTETVQEKIIHTRK